MDSIFKPLFNVLCLTSTLDALSMPRDGTLPLPIPCNLSSGESPSVATEGRLPTNPSSITAICKNFQESFSALEKMQKAAKCDEVPSETTCTLKTTYRDLTATSYDCTSPLPEILKQWNSQKTEQMSGGILSCSYYRPFSETFVNFRI